MKILYAPYNIASMPAITMDALNKHSNIDAKGVSIMNSKLLSFGSDPDRTWKIFNVYGSLRNPISFLKNSILAEYYLCKRILWSDAIIWQWDTRIYLPHFWFLRFCNKPILVEWLGSDIRIPEFVMEHNSYYKHEVENKSYSYLNESKSRSLHIQKKFKFLKAIPYLCPEMTLFLDRTIFPRYYSTFQRINVKKYQAIYPDEINKKVTVVHTPSSTGAKGTKYVRDIVSKLKERFDFEYVEIHNKTHQEALNAIKESDIFLDQFIGGSYGMATCEAMAMGKPVFCFLMEPVIHVLPSDCPIVNANPDTLENKLVEYLLDPALRHNTGVLSRRFVETYHDADILVVELIKHLQKMIN